MKIKPEPINELEIPADAQEILAQVNAELAIDTTNLSLEYSTYSAMYCGWSLKLAETRRLHELDTMECEELEARLAGPIREGMGTKCTETQVKQQMRLDPKYNEKLCSVAHLAYLVNVLTACVRAYERKSEMLISLGATQRHEQQYLDPVIKR